MFAITVGDEWRPGIGDPTPLGWLTTAAYLVAAVLCGLAARGLHAGPRRDPRGLALWIILALILLALGLNKQLDLQTWLTIALKRRAVAGGWYERRRAFQAAFIAGIAAAGVAGLAALILICRGAPRRRLVAVAGLLLLGCFVAIRAASFHHVDAMLGLELEGVRLNHVLELGGIAVCLGAAWLELAGRGARGSREPGGAG